MHAPCLPGIFTDLPREERPWKVVRRVSRQVYAEIRKGGVVDRRSLAVITALAWNRNRTQEWMTAAELADFMFRRKRIKRNDPRLVAPRITELIKGEVITLPNGEKTRRGGGVLTYLPMRRCRITGMSAHPVAIREAGSQERQVA